MNTSDPIWVPDADTIAAANITQFGRVVGHESLAELQAWSVEHPAAFWGGVTSQLDIQFRNPATEILDLSQGVEQPHWLVGAKLNIVESCFRAPADALAVTAWEPTGPLQLSYGQLLERVQQVAASIRAGGFHPGDRLAIVMPMNVESVVIYLAIIYAGCTAVSVADSFAAPEIAKRLDISAAKAVFCCDQFTRGGRQLDVYARIVAAGAARAIVIRDHPQQPLRDADLDYAEEFLVPDQLSEPSVGAPEHFINVLFSSGTTGDPKAIPWNQTVPIKCASDGFFHHDIHAGDVVCWPTNLGWMMGPWLIFAALVNRATIALYHDAPTSGEFGQFVQNTGVTMLGVVPTLVRAWRAAGCMEPLDWSAIRCFSSTGEASHPEDMRYLSQLAGGKPIMEYCGGTEIGGGYISSTVVQPNVASQFSTPALGSRFLILDDHQQPATAGQLYLVPPALGLSTTLLNRDHHETYFAGCPRGPTGEVLRRHGDHFRQLPAGYYQAGGRVDDTMNLGGIKISAAEIEETLNRHALVRETAAVAVPTDGGGPDQLVVFVVPVGEQFNEDDLLRELNVLLREQLNPLFKISSIESRDSLPRTASNKIMRRELRRKYPPTTESAG